MTKRRFEKHVAIKATDDEERIATGLVLRPNVLDRQLDFFERDGIEAMFNPSPSDGVMHAAFPDGHAELVRNEVLSAGEEIDGVQFETGDWIIRRKYHDEQRYQLVKDGVLGGFSMGGHISEETPFESIDDLPDDVEIPDVVDPDAVRGTQHWPPTRAENGAVEEISDVDIPAVPDAEMAAVKSARVKNVLEQTSGEAEFVELMRERGHDDADARVLYDYLTAVTDEHDMTDNNDIESMDDATLGKRLKRFLLGGSEPDDAGEPAEVSDTAKTFALAEASAVLKEGRPLNATNREALMAAHDAIEQTLASDIDFETNRFTDTDGIDFSIEEFGKLDGEQADAILKSITEEQAETVVDMVDDFVDAAGEATFGDFRDWVTEQRWGEDADLDPAQVVALDRAIEDFLDENDPDEQPVTDDFAGWLGAQTATETQTMSDEPNDTDDGDDVDVAELAATVESLTETVEQLDEKIDDDGDDEEKSAEEQVAELEEKISEQEAELEEARDRLDKLSSATADTTQSEKAETDPVDAEADGLDLLAKGLGGGS